MRLDRAAGAALVAVAAAGYLFVADDLRHTGEFIGVTSLLAAGILLLAGSAASRPAVRTFTRATAAGTFPGMLLGAGLDDMLLGVVAGMACGALCALAVTVRAARPRRT